MNSRSDSHNDAAMHQALKYIVDFSTQAVLYQSEKTEESLVLINRSASLLRTTIQPQHFAPTHLEIAKFYIDLHALMGTLDVNADAMWSCVALLQHCSRNLESRQAIIDEYRFVPQLSFILKRTDKQDRVHKLLVLLQDLTYGICITWEEPYLFMLLELLVDIINSATDENEESHALLALSILVNLCYKNFVSLFLFLRLVNISNFCRKIQNFGMLANKMLIILSEDIHAFAQRELQTFLRSAFSSIDECIKNWNVPHLKHIVDFLLDSKSHSGLHRAMLTYAHYCEDVEHLLGQLETRNTMDDSTEDSRKQQQICMGLLFKLINYILELSSVPLVEEKENIISIDAVVPRIYELICNWLESDICGADAIILLDSLLRLTRHENITPRIAHDPSILTQIITISEKSESAPQHTTAILQLLLTLLRQPKTEKLILSKITESYFDKLLAPLLALKPELTNKHAVVQDEIEKSIFCLLLLINFANIAKKAYFDKCCSLLEMHQTQYALARAILGSNVNVCAAVFQISQFEHFPEAAVSKHIANNNQDSSNAAHPTELDDVNDQWRKLNAILKNHRSFVDNKITERLNALIDVVSTAQHKNQLHDVPTSQIVELYNYRIEIFNCAERSMQQCLENASTQHTHLTHRINIQNAELEKYRSVNFELLINQERLQTQCEDLKKQKDKLKSTMTDLLKKLAEQTEALQISEKRLAVKMSEIIVLQKECCELKAELETKSNELKKHDVVIKENILRIEKLKKSVIAYEQDIKEKVRTLDEKEREISKTHKQLEEQKEARKKSEDLVSVLETQLQEKMERINNLELELSETEEMRKTIMSIMESKKPKRKP